MNMISNRTASRSLRSTKETARERKKKKKKENIISKQALKSKVYKLDLHCVQTGNGL